MYDFDILESTKPGFNAEEHYILVRDRTIYLRVVGGNNTYTVMTATAGEGEGGPAPCGDKARLIAAAIQLCSELDLEPHFTSDSSRREFVDLFVINVVDDGQDDAEQLRQMFARFLAIFDAIGAEGNAANASDLCELYETMAPDETGADVYLTDGVWLRKDGSVFNDDR